MRTAGMEERSVGEVFLHVTLWLFSELKSAQVHARGQPPPFWRAGKLLSWIWRTFRQSNLWLRNVTSKGFVWINTVDVKAVRFVPESQHQIGPSPQSTQLLHTYSNRNSFDVILEKQMHVVLPHNNGEGKQHLCRQNLPRTQPKRFFSYSSFIPPHS